MTVNTERNGAPRVTGGRSELAILAHRVARRAHGEVVQLKPQRAGLFAARLLPSFAFGYVRTLLLRWSGIRIERQSSINGPVHLTGPGFHCDLVSIGRNTIISGPLYLDVGAAISIGSNVRIGHHVKLHTIDHEIGGPEQRAGTHRRRPVTIEDGAWICSHAVILPGVTVGRGAVVAAGALVAKDVPANVLVGGVPARPIRTLPGARPAELPAAPSSRVYIAGAVPRAANGAR
jgi:acetyltransferase-like isoleucine patch superfamily enzyme